MLSMVLPSPLKSNDLAALAAIARPRVSRAGRRRAPAGAAGRASIRFAVPSSPAAGFEWSLLLAGNILRETTHPPLLPPTGRQRPRRMAWAMASTLASSVALYNAYEARQEMIAGKRALIAEKGAFYGKKRDHMRRGQAWRETESMFMDMEIAWRQQDQARHLLWQRFKQFALLSEVFRVCACARVSASAS